MVFSESLLIIRQYFIKSLHFSSETAVTTREVYNEIEKAKEERLDSLTPVTY